MLAEVGKPCSPYWDSAPVYRECRNLLRFPSGRVVGDEMAFVGSWLYYLTLRLLRICRFTRSCVPTPTIGLQAACSSIEFDDALPDVYMRYLLRQACYAACASHLRYSYVVALLQQLLVELFSSVKLCTQDTVEGTIDIQITISLV